MPYKDEHTRSRRPGKRRSPYTTALPVSQILRDKRRRQRLTREISDALNLFTLQAIRAGGLKAVSGISRRFLYPSRNVCLHSLQRVFSESASALKLTAASWMPFDRKRVQPEPSVASSVLSDEYRFDNHRLGPRDALFSPVATRRSAGAASSTAQSSARTAARAQPDAAATLEVDRADRDRRGTPTS